MVAETALQKTRLVLSLFSDLLHFQSTLKILKRKQVKTQIASAETINYNFLSLIPQMECSPHASEL